ncbi:hypothetical protein PC9H_011452 [Pleurotus ostreatus]|uniref:Uncharacterized protein n=1 Tax=Pleurotus ostreatus TaxID=5322 RepID=A0A8H6ZL36_PLEOS|nr:uncharacterized protein PC9H_011452 [Pleurotus ostreatus]KAF7420933.1 hypothetical protein PC9H_011452 [Pleurotus ostreatus]
MELVPTLIRLSTDGHTFKYCLPYSSERKPPNVEIHWASSSKSTTRARGRSLTPSSSRIVHFAEQDMGEEGDINTQYHEMLNTQNPELSRRGAAKNHHDLPTTQPTTTRQTRPASIEQHSAVAGPSSLFQRTNEPPHHAMPDFTQPPKHRKVYNEDFYLELYTSYGPSKLRCPPQLPAQHTASIGHFLLHVIDGQNAIQVWRIDGFGPDGHTEWVDVVEGDVELINGKEYRLAYSGGMLGWVTNNTVDRQARRKSNGKGKAKA